MRCIGLLALPLVLLTPACTGDRSDAADGGSDVAGEVATCGVREGEMCMGSVAYGRVGVAPMPPAAEATGTVESLAAPGMVLSFGGGAASTVTWDGPSLGDAFSPGDPVRVTSSSLDPGASSTLVVMRGPRATAFTFYSKGFFADAPPATAGLPTMRHTVSCWTTSEAPACGPAEVISHRMGLSVSLDADQILVPPGGAGTLRGWTVKSVYGADRSPCQIGACVGEGAGEASISGLGPPLP